jgi:hypothetical protein
LNIPISFYESGSLHYFWGIKINGKNIKTAAQYWALHSAHGLRCSRAGGPLSSLGRIGSGPGCHDHCGPASPCQRDALGTRSGRAPCTGPTRWRGLRRPTVGQGAGAPVGLAPAGEGVGSGHSRGDGRSPVGRRDGEGAPGTSTAPGVALQLREGNERVRSARI